MRNGRGKRSGERRRLGRIGRTMCRLERRLLGLGMRGVATFADRQMNRYHAREAAAASGGEHAES